MGCNGNGGFHYQRFYQSIIRTVEYWSESERAALLEWWDRSVLHFNFIYSIDSLAHFIVPFSPIQHSTMMARMLRNLTTTIVPHFHH